MYVTFLCVMFSVRRKGSYPLQCRGGGMWAASSAERVVVPGCHQVNWVGEVEIVSKTCVYFGMKRFVNELLVVRDMLKWSLCIFFCVATTINGIATSNSRSQAILCQIWRTTLMVLRTLGPPIEVSNVVIKDWQWMACVFGCGDNNCEICQGFHTL